jgi:hypothetical protein
METVVSIAIGFVVSMIITALVMPAYGHALTLGDNAAITGWFTVASVIRGYYVRRLFNWFHAKQSRGQYESHQL